MLFMANCIRDSYLATCPLRGCISLIKVPDLRTAKGVTNMLGLFENCTSLVDISSVYMALHTLSLMPTSADSPRI